MGEKGIPKQLINKLFKKITKVFVEQPLTLPGSARDIYIYFILHNPDQEKTHANMTKW